MQILKKLPSGKNAAIIVAEMARSVAISQNKFLQEARIGKATLHRWQHYESAVTEGAWLKVNAAYHRLKRRRA